MQSASIWKNLTRNIGKQFSESCDTCVDPIVFVFNLVGLEIVAGYVDSDYAGDLD